MKLLRLLPALVLLAPLALVGCDEADPGDPGDAPPVLAPAAFALGTDSFPEEAAGVQGQFGDNWLNASLRVGFVSLAVGVHLIVPSVATAAATQADPYVEDGTWIWEDDVVINTSEVTFRLEGTPDGTETEWQMIISSANLGGVAYDAFTLYEATTALDGESGTWRLFYEIEGERTEVLDAEFDAGGDEDELTFTVPETNPNVEARGSTVHYGAHGDALHFEWHEEAADNEHLVEWSASTGAGSITATNYNDGERACWDENLEDVPCD
jgi:hypothetical protein